MNQICYIGMPHIYSRLSPGNVYDIYRETDDYYLLEDDSTKYEKNSFFVYEKGSCQEDFDSSRYEDLYGDWRIPELNSLEELSIRLRRITPLLTEEKIKQVNFNDIQWYGFDLPDRLLGNNCFCCGGSKFKSADTSKLGILLDGTTTYSGRRYRSMDGSHRIQKMIQNGLTEYKFYVLNFSDVKEYFVPESNYYINE